MWLIAIIILFNSIADNKDFVLAYRIELGGLPINILDGLLILGALLSVLPIARSKSAIPENVHPTLAWVLGLFVVAGLAGYAGAVLNNTPHYVFMATMRNVLTVPAAVWIGYRFTPSLPDAKKISYIWLFGSFASAIVALIFVRGAADKLELSTTGFNELRNTNLGGDMGIVALAFLLLSLASGFRVVPFWMALGMMCTCSMAAFLVPHRSQWTGAVATSVFAIYFLSGQRISRKAWITIVGIIVGVILIVVSTQLLSQQTGRNFGDWFYDRLVSLMPGAGDPGQTKAWEGRLVGATRELQIWARNPLFGQGFGIQYMDSLFTGISSYNHNSWTAIMSETGLFGLAGYLLVTLGTMVIGRRMVRDETDAGSVFLGGVGAIVAFFYFAMGTMTMSFNIERPALMLGLACGMVLRTRALQLAGIQQLMLTEQQQSPSALQSHPAFAG
jgi:hypothetical protein